MIILGEGKHAFSRLNPEDGCVVLVPGAGTMQNNIAFAHGTVISVAHAVVTATFVDWLGVNITRAFSTLDGLSLDGRGLRLIPLGVIHELSP